MPKPKYGAPGNVMGVSAIAQQMMEAKKKLDSSNQIDVDIDIDNNPTKSIPKKKEKKKKKKRKAEEALLLLGDKKLVEEDHHHPLVKKAKKKKSKKEKKALKKKISRNSMDVDVGVEDEVAHDAEEDSIHKDFDDESSTITAPLEGQMVMHQGESIFVLIDASKSIVYAMKRSELGGLVPIGKVSADGIVRITGTLFVLRVVSS
jgi:acetyl/propionyl-CoA carboxylase alpha subunit